MATGGKRVAPDGAPSHDRLNPVEHRAYRELYVACRQLTRRWERLAAALEGTDVARVLEDGCSEAHLLVEELTPRIAAYDLHAGPAAGGVGARIADARNVVTDRAADTGMVVRFAVLDIDHVATLLAHLAELARARADRDLAAFCDRWGERMRDRVDAVRDVAVALGADPERAAAPLHGSLVGRAAHGAGWVMGALGEAVDRAAARRRS
jgi:hypothetical protein